MAIEIVQRLVCDCKTAHACEVAAVKRVEFTFFGVTYEKDLCGTALVEFRAVTGTWTKGARRVDKAAGDEVLPTLIVERAAVNVTVVPGTEWWVTPADVTDAPGKRRYSEQREVIKVWARAQQPERFTGLNLSRLGRLPLAVGEAWTREVYLGEPLAEKPEDRLKPATISLFHSAV
jgi:hypothetical protein